MSTTDIPDETPDAKKKRLRNNSRRARKFSGGIIPAAMINLSHLTKSLPADASKHVPDIEDFEKSLEAMARKVKKNDLSDVESMLISQASALNLTFGMLAFEAAGLERGGERFQRISNLALRSQAQCVNTLRVLAELKQGPRVVFAQQLNSANQQIVNNGSELPQGQASRKVRSAQSHGSSPATLLDQSSTLLSHASMDRRSPTKTPRNHPKLVPVDEKHRTTDHGGKADMQPKRMEGRTPAKTTRDSKMAAGDRGIIRRVVIPITDFPEPA